jgi:ubiquinone biosynthesis protein
MKSTSLPRTWRHLRRYRQIIGVFLKYGFDEVVYAAQKDLVLRFGRKVIPKLGRDTGAGMTRAQRLRHAAEELGPTFIKMGQILSSRPDIIPPDIAAELQKLQDEVTPLPFERIREVIERESGRPAQEILPRIDPEPLAAASIAQVHRAALHDGTEVVVKVQRPGIQKVIEVDLEILFDLAQILVRRSKDLPIQDPVGIVEEYDRSIHRELDFFQEGRNIARFKRMFADDPTVVIPNYYPQYSSRRVLVMDYINGIKVSDLDRIRSANLDPGEIARRGARLVLTQVFEHGFFHADPHPGNIMVLPDNVIAPLDYGMVGYLSDATIEELGNALIGTIRRDVRRVMRSFDQLGIIQTSENREELQDAIDDFINRYYETPLKQLNLEVIAAEVFQIVQRYRLKVPSNLSLMMKALISLGGLGLTLNPDFDLVSEARPYAKRIMMKRFDPRRKVQSGVIMLDDLYRLGEEFPAGVRDILHKARRGLLRLQFEHRNLEDLVGEMHRSSNRIAAALIIAALIVGSSMVVQSSLGPLLFGMPILGLFGYLLASVLGLRLVWEIFRSKSW